MVNKPFQMSPHDVLQLWLINTVYHLSVKNKSGEGRRGGRLIEDLLYAKNIFSRHFVSPHIRDDRSQQVFFCTKDVMGRALWCHLSSLPSQFSIFEDMGGVNSSSVGHLLWSPLWRKNFSMWCAVAQFHHCQCSVQKYSKAILHCNLIKWSLTHSCSAF